VEFENKEHEKAWLIVTAKNLCRNHLKSWWQKNGNLEEEMHHLSMEEEADQNLLEIVMKLPEKYRVTLYLYYYEGYDSAEIAKLMEKPSSTVRNYLQRGRERLKVMLGEDIFEKQ
jgi:RNA polymerase sigma-70 factor (ECF subfamily)